MKRNLFVCSCLLAAGTVLAAEPTSVDTANLRKLQEVQVISTRASEKAPMAVTMLRKSDIKAKNFGKDIPFLLSGTPSALTTSDAGTGIGYTSLRIRGTDATRINVTANGIPLNDSESNSLYWVNMPDLATSLGSIQIQRGVGTSTNGSGAFDATVNLQTEGISDQPYTTIDLSAGSYGTHKENVQFGTGLLEGHWGFSGRLSNVGSDGYIDRASARLNSYFFQGGYFGDRTVVKFITFNGTEQTYHAWDYATREQMAQYGRRYNPCGIYTNAAGETTYYRDQKDNYHQQHYQLLWNQMLTANLNLNAAVHYTHGYGYYEQYKSNQKLYKYALPNMGRSDLIRRKILDNDFYGTVLSLNYQKEGLQATVGGGWNKYDGDHIGRITWLRTNDGSVDPNFVYYDNRAHKQDANIYGKVNYEIVNGLNAYADLQYRYIDYRMHGPSDIYEGNNRVDFNLNTSFSFLNPKVGIYWSINPAHTVYASYGLAQKEPTRNDFEDNILSTQPKSEKLNDFELGYKLNITDVTMGLNFYYMLYKDQFVLTGEQNAIGEMIARNVGDSYRSGIEYIASWKVFEWLRWDYNATWSRNRSKNLKFLLDDTGEYYNVKSAPLSFSPEVIQNTQIAATWKGFTATLQEQYVSKQYMTTTGLQSYDDGGKDVSLTLDAYGVTNFDLSYQFKRAPFGKNLTLGCTVYNIFSKKYESYGAAYTATKSNGLGGMMGYQDSDWNSYSVYSAQAPAHFMAHLSIGF